MTRYYFIVNPVAAAGACLKRFAAVQKELARRGVRYTAVYSERPGHAGELARLALRGDAGCVVSAGGDGTFREIAEVMMGSGIPLGILPFGTGNDLIRALGIPADPGAALEALLEGSPRKVDAVTANGQLFVNVAGLGFDVDVLEKTRHYKDSLRVRGIFPYILGILHALLQPKTYHIKARSREQSLDMDAFLVSVGNGTHIGGGMMVTPLADMSDGLLDICAVRRVGRLKVLRCLTKFIRGKHLGLDITTYFKTRELTVESEPPARVQLDGEIIETTPVTFKVRPGALSILV